MFPSSATFSIASFFIFLLIFHAPALATSLPPLNKTRLNCCVLEQRPVLYRNDREKPYPYEGLAIKYLRRLEDHLGISCASIFAPSYSNAGFTSFIHDMGNCSNGLKPSKPRMCECDIGVGGWMETEERYNHVEFPTYFMNLQLIVMTHMDTTNTSTSGLFFITSFTPKVWCLILGLVMSFILIKMIDNRFMPPDGSFYAPLPETEPWVVRFRHFLLESGITTRLWNAIQSTFENMLGYGELDSTRTRRSKLHWLFNIVIVLCGLFLVLAYEATMTASLVQESISSTYKSINSFLNCGITPRDTCMTSGDVTESFWNKSIATKACQKEAAKNGEGPRVKRTYSDLIESVAKKECKFALVDEMLLHETVNTDRYCRKLVTVGEPVYWGGISYILPRGSELKRAIEKVTLGLRGDGKLETLKQFYGKGSCDLNGQVVLNARKLLLFFSMGYGACVVFVLGMVLSRMTPSAEMDGDDDDDDDEGCEDGERMRGKREACMEGGSSECGSSGDWT